MTKHDPNKAPKMDWEAVKAEVHRRGMTLGELSKRAGCHEHACGQLRSRNNYIAQAAVAAFIGEKPEDLWPSRYPRRRSRILDTKKYPPVDSQKSDCGSDRADAA